MLPPGEISKVTVLVCHSKDHADPHGLNPDHMVLQNQCYLVVVVSKLCILQYTVGMCWSSAPDREY